MPSQSPSSTPSHKRPRTSCGSSAWGPREPKLRRQPYVHALSKAKYSEAVLTLATDMIDTKSQEIKPADNQIYSDMLELADELPDSSPRFILLSYPFTLVCLIDG
jgi:hypothetical protein